MSNLVYRHSDGTVWESTDHAAFLMLFTKEDGAFVQRFPGSFEKAKQYGIIREQGPVFEEGQWYRLDSHGGLIAQYGRELLWVGKGGANIDPADTQVAALPVCIVPKDKLDKLREFLVDTGGVVNSGALVVCVADLLEAAK